IHRVSISDNPLKRFEIDQMIPDNGVTSPFGVTLIERNRHLIWGRDNFFLYAGGYDLEPIGDNIRTILFGENSEEHPDSIEVHRLFYIEEINEVWAAYQGSEDTDLVRLLIYRMREQAWSRALLADPIRAAITPPTKVFLTWNDLVGTWAEQTKKWYELY